MNKKISRQAQMDTVTTEISGIQMKSLYLHFKTIRINANIIRINSLEFVEPDSPKSIASKGEILYDTIDAITLFESYHSICDDILKSPNIGPNIPPDLGTYLKLTRKKMAQWKHVRNNLGGHLNLQVIQGICENNNYKGVFISNQLEADFKGVLLHMMLGNAINETLEKSKLFEEEVDLTQPSDLIKFIELFMSDWKLALGLFSKLNEFLYQVGKEDKMKLIGPNDIGIIKF